jgi:hypothetical protein
MEHANDCEMVIRRLSHIETIDDLDVSSIAMPAPINHEIRVMRDKLRPHTHSDACIPAS